MAMEGETQHLDVAGEREEEDTLNNAHPVAYLRVLPQEDVEECVFAITEGENAIGRSSECEVAIAARSLSRRHAVILVEDHTHFLQDCDSRNRTYRKDVALRPNTYYELTNQCEVTFGNMKCIYHIGELPEGERNTEEVEQTQSYNFEEVGGANVCEGGEGSEGGDSSAPKEDATGDATGEASEGGEGGAASNSEATQPYDVDESAMPMDCEATVAYNIEDGEDADSVASSPLLGGGADTIATQFYPVDKPAIDESDSNTEGEDGNETHEEANSSDGKEELSADKVSTTAKREPHKRKVCFDNTVAIAAEPPSSDAESENTLPYEDSDREEEEASSKPGEQETTSKPEATSKPGEPGASRATTDVSMDIEPTVAYDLEGAIQGEEPTIAYDISEATASDEDNVQKQKKATKDKILDATVPYTVEDTSNTPQPEATVPYSPLETSENDAALLDPTVPYPLPDFSEVGDSCLDPTVPCGLGVGPQGGDGRDEKQTDRESDAKTDDSRVQSAVDGSKGKVQKSVRRGKQKAGTNAIPKKGAKVLKKNIATAKNAVESHDNDAGSHDQGDEEREVDQKDIKSHDQRNGSCDLDEVKSKPRRGHTEKTQPVKPDLKTLDTVVSMDIGPSCYGDGGTVALETVAPEPPDVDEKTEDGGTGTELLELDETVTEPAAATRGGTKRQATGRGRGRGRKGRGQPRGGKAPIATMSVVSMEIDFPTLEPAATKNQRSKRGRSAKVSTDTVPDLADASLEPEASSHDKDNQSDCSSVTSKSEASTKSSSSVRSKRGRGQSGSSTPTNKRRSSASRTPTFKSEGSARRPRSSPLGVAPPPSELPRVMFTGMIDKEGERTVRELGGKLVDSVYECTHLITDKVRRTVKFLCCLSRGCLIISDSWLDECALQRCFLPAQPFLVKDRVAERQHDFSLARSHETAKVGKVLEDVKIYLTEHTKPDREQMKDIIKCSGGEVLALSPATPGDGVVIVTCPEDLSACRAAFEAGVPVHSTELILGGVLKQELDLHSHLLTLPPEASSVAGRKRATKETSLLPPAKRKRKN